MKYYELISMYPNLFRNNGVPLKIITDPDTINAWQEKRRKQLKDRNEPETWADIGILLDDPYILIVRDLVEFPGGQRGGYLRLINKADLLGGQGVAVLPVLGDNVLLVYHYRHATRAWHWEIPRGFGEPSTPADLQARNEISEEVEGEIETLIDLGATHNNTGIEGNTVKLFWARVSRVGQPSVNEGIEKIKWVKVPELEAMIREKVITDGFTLAAYARAKLMGLL